MIDEERIKNRIEYCEKLIQFIISEHIIKREPIDYSNLAKQYMDVGQLKEEIEILNWVLGNNYRFDGKVKKDKVGNVIND